MVRILIIDDEESILKSLTWVLKKEGYEVIGVGEFNNAQELIQNSNFDIYIIDIFFPDRNGMDLIKLINKLEKSGIIIIITGYPNAPTLIDSMRFNAYDYIKKPFSYDYLKKIIEHIITVQQKRLNEKSIIST